MTTPDLTHERLYTVEEFAALPDDGRFYELVGGRIVEVTPADSLHSAVAVRIGRLLDAFVDDSGAGTVTGEQGGYLLSEDTVRAPDVAFIRADRQRKTGPYFEGAPDLAVEVLSPDDAASAVRAKIKDYFAAGARLVWIVDRFQREITVYRTATDAHILTEADTLDGGDVLPGFRVPVRKIFAVLDPPSAETA
jgi:Uma2 family endonuclease